MRHDIINAYQRFLIKMTDQVIDQTSIIMMHLILKILLIIKVMPEKIVIYGANMLVGVGIVMVIRTYTEHVGYRDPMLFVKNADVPTRLQEIVVIVNKLL